MNHNRKNITLVIAAISLLFFAFSFINTEERNVSASEVRKVEHRLHKLQRTMNKYVAQVENIPVNEWIQIDDFPEDMVIYRYNADTLQSWINQFSISNDEVDVIPYWYRLHHMSNNNLYNTPLAYIAIEDQYMNLGLSWYVVKAYTSGTIKIITGIKIKDEYPADNMSIVGKVNPSLHMRKGFTASTLDMNTGSVVNNSDGVELFSIIPEVDSSNLYRDYTLRYISLLLILFTAFFFHSWRRSKVSLIVMLVVVLIGRIYTRILYQNVDPTLPIFSPVLYADSRLFNCFGSLLFNNLFVFLIIDAFYLMHKQFYRLVLAMGKKVKRRWAIGFSVGCVALIAYNHLTLASLVNNSSIMLDLFRITELSLYSILSYVSYAFLYLGLLFFIQMTATLYSAPRRRIRVMSFKNVVIYSALVTLYSVSTVALYGYAKELRTSQVWTNKLAVDRDLALEIQLREVEDLIASDQLIGALSGWEDGGPEVIGNRILERYFYNNFSQNYDIAITTCASNSMLIINQYTLPVDCYDFYTDEITNYGVQLAPSSRFFYMNSYYGNTVYIGVFSYMNLQTFQTTKLFVEIVRKFSNDSFKYPEGMKTESDVRQSIPSLYSYAKYNGGFLTNSSGDFNYTSKDQYSEDKLGYHLHRSDKYIHFINKLSQYEVIVVSRPIRPLYTYLVSFSYVFLLFCLIFLICTSGMRHQSILTLPSHSFKRKLTLMMVLTLGSALICVGVGTIIYALNRTNENNEKQIESQMDIVQSSLSEFCQYTLRYNDLDITLLYDEMERLAENLQSDVNIFDTHGHLIRSTKPELFEQYIMGSRMNDKAFYNIVKKDATRYIAEDNVAGNKYLSVYAPLFNVDGNLVAIANIPFISTSSEMQSDAMLSVATIINIYLLILFAGLLIGLTLANSITKPLTVIKSRMESLTIDDNRKEHINYPNNKDELGVLVNAYNKMVDDLQESTSRLAETEREQAWKEMARQIAHEIKNPLTPMRLSIQHMIRLKHQNVAGWEDRFEQLSSSLLEQIDILSETANEFSSFSKFYNEDETVENLESMLYEQVILFGNREDVSVSFVCNEEEPLVRVRKKQLLRAFVNLIANAVQAVESQSEAKVVVTVTSLNEKEYSISIEDNGPGVSLENRNKLFKPNFTTKSSGTGLGLAISRSIVEQSRGTISYKTSSMGGASFVIILPKFFY